MAIGDIEGVLLDACRGDVSRVTAGNWRDVVDLAAVHEVTPLLAFHLRARALTPSSSSTTAAISDQPSHVLGRPYLPDECRLTVERQHATSVIQTGLLMAELSTVLSCLGQIPVLVLKGPSLAIRYYPAGTRLSRDIDLLVHAHRYPQARAALTALGYRVMEAYDEDIQRRQSKDVAFIRTDGGGKTWSVELHWRLTEPGAPSLDEAAIWSNAEPVNLDGATFMTTGAEDTILLLALNLRKHRFACLKTVCDINRLVEVEGQGLNWRRLHDQAHRHGLCALLRQSLSLSAVMFGCAPPPLPDCVRRRGLPMRLLRRLAGTDAVFAGSRRDGPATRVSGLIPFVSLDNPASTLYLAYDRLKLSPELASYYRSGATNVYASRLEYWRDTGHRLFQAVKTLADGKIEE